MSMSTHAKGFRPPDEKWHQMKAVWEASEAAGLQVPEAVREFFNWHAPEENGIEVEIESATAEWKNDYCSGLVVELAKLPSNITHIRFENCW